MKKKRHYGSVTCHIFWSHCLHNVLLYCGVDLKFRKVAILKDFQGCNYGIIKKKSWLQWIEINSECLLSEVTLHPVICSGIKNTELTDILLALGVTFFHLQRGEKDKNSMYGGRLRHSKQNKNVCAFCICSRSQEYPTLTTFFAGEIISRKRPFLTRKWDADEDVDRKHWVSWSVPNLHACSVAWCFTVT